MLVPSIWGEDLFDDFMRFPTTGDFRRTGMNDWSKGLMKTDIKETENGYELSVELPGYVKDDVSIKLDNGYLTISASKNETKEDKDENGYIRKERYQGQRSRSYFVGEYVKPEDIKAKMENGILTVDFPKVEPVEETAQNIMIEG